MLIRALDYLCTLRMVLVLHFSHLSYSQCHLFLLSSPTGAATKDEEQWLRCGSCTYNSLHQQPNTTSILLYIKFNLLVDYFIPLVIYTIKTRLMSVYIYVYMYRVLIHFCNATKYTILSIRLLSFQTYSPTIAYFTPPIKNVIRQRSIFILVRPT